MVLRDLSENNSAQIQYSPAPYLDRFFASIIDFLILAPMISLFCGGISNDLRWAVFSKNSSDIYSLVFQYGFVSFALFLLYEVMFIYFYSATPGHRFLYMQVVADKNLKPSLMQILFRTAFKFQGILFLCIPFIEIVLRADRSTFYDRLAQTKLVSLRQSKYDEIHPEFRKIILRWTHTAIIFSFLVLGLVFYKTVSKGPDQNGSVKSSLKCTDSLTQHLKNYLSKSKESENLNCSRDLVEKSFGSKKPATAVNYLAQYIVTPIDELKESYRTKYCQSASKKLLCQTNAAIDFSNVKPDEEDILNLLVEMNAALVKNDHARVFTILDVLYTHVEWNRNLELYYLTSYVFLTERSDRAPASERKQQDEWLAKKARFLKRMSVVL